MASVKGKTKIITCAGCKAEVEVSLYAKTTDVLCTDCKPKSSGEARGANSEWLAKPEKLVPLTKQQKTIRQAVKKELDSAIWQWRRISNEKISLKILNTYGQEGWKFAFYLDDGIYLQKLKQ